MKIVVIGGTGLIGTKLVNSLRKIGHEVVAASPRSGVNTITGEGLATALAGAQVVVDVANSPSWEDKAVLDLFETQVATSLPQKRSLGWDITLHCRLSAPNAYLRAVTSERRWPKRPLSRPPRFHIRSSAQRSSSNSWTGSSNQPPMGKRLGCHLRVCNPSCRMMSLPH